MKGFLTIKSVLSLAALLCAFQLVPLAATPPSPKTEAVTARLVTEEASVQPGRPFWVGVELTMAKGWDTYWKNPGDAGFATQVAWQLPEGFTAGPLVWPTPQVFTSQGTTVFGYTDKVVLLSEITPPSTVGSEDPLTLAASVNWLACNESCVPGGAQLSLSLPLSGEVPLPHPEHSTLFVAARAALPTSLEGNITVTYNENALLLRLPATSFSHQGTLSFLPEENYGINYATQVYKEEQGNKVIQLPLTQPLEEGRVVKGLLLSSEGGRAVQVEAVAQPAGGGSPAAASVGGISTFRMALLAAFLGGIILNVMPCVLPVIALKILSFVKMARERRGVILQHGAVFSIGVLLSFWCLSGILLILRTYGQGVGWGFQLQEPIFVALLAGVLFLLGLSLFGLFEFGTSMAVLEEKVTTSGEGSGLKKSFLSGVLATLVATPCTGPMLGPALGFAMTLLPIQTLLVFTMMGLGMAFPYLLLSAFPKLMRFLPKPGNWLITFKHLMGFLMMGTVAWLVWVFGAQTDNAATFTLLLGLLVLAVGGWVFGRWATPARRRGVRLVATSVAACMLCLGGGSVVWTAQHYRDAETPARTEKQAEEGMWEVYDPLRVETLRSQGVPVFVDFTAKWCLICQANKIVLHSAEVTNAFKEKGVVTMLADWTKRDPVITAQLEKLGRTGVPVYVLYSSDPTQPPQILPQTLSSGVVQDALDTLTSLPPADHAD